MAQKSKNKKDGWYRIYYPPPGVNVTLCTLYRSCSELQHYQQPRRMVYYCPECKITYNHCPWIAGYEMPRCGTSQFWILNITKYCLFMLFLETVYF